MTGVPPKQYTINKNGELIWRNLLNPKVNYQPRFLDLLDKMVRYRHQERYTSAGAVLADLKQLDAEENENEETILLKNNTGSSSSIRTELVSKTAGGISKETKIISGLPKSSANQRSLGANAVSPTKHPQSKKSQVKLLSAIAAALVLLGGGIGAWIFLQQEDSEPDVSLSLYENPNHGFKVDYPEVWSKQNRDDFFATGVTFFSPLEGEADDFKEEISILIENLPSGVSLKEYTEDSIAEVKKLSDPNVGEAEAANLGKNEARQIIYKGEVNGSTVQRMQTWSVENNRAYILTYTAKPDSYNTYLPTVEKIMKSFETIE